VSAEPTRSTAGDGDVAEDGMNVEKAIEILQCAEYNCDSIHRVGLVMVNDVKMQIQSAIKELGGDVGTADVAATLDGVTGI